MLKIKKAPNIRGPFLVILFVLAQGAPTNEDRLLCSSCICCCCVGSCCVGGRRRSSSRILLLFSFSTTTASNECECERAYHCQCDQFFHSLQVLILLQIYYDRGILGVYVVKFWFFDIFWPCSDVFCAELHFSLAGSQNNTHFFLKKNLTGTPVKSNLSRSLFSRNRL